MDASSRVLNHDQMSGRNEEMRRALRGLSRTFQRNPRYRGRTFADVRDELCEEAIAAQDRRRWLVAQAPGAPETGAELARLDAEWAPFGGPDWAAMLASDVAGVRMRYEQEAEFCRRPNYTVARWQRDRERWAKHAARTHAGTPVGQPGPISLWFWRRKRGLPLEQYAPILRDTLQATADLWDVESLFRNKRQGVEDPEELGRLLDQAVAESIASGDHLYGLVTQLERIRPQDPDLLVFHVRCIAYCRARRIFLSIANNNYMKWMSLGSPDSFQVIRERRRLSTEMENHEKKLGVGVLADRLAADLRILRDTRPAVFDALAIPQDARRVLGFDDPDTDNDAPIE